MRWASRLYIGALLIVTACASSTALLPRIERQAPGAKIRMRTRTHTPPVRSTPRTSNVAEIFGTTTVQHLSGGRAFLLHASPDPDRTPRPLVIALHRAASSARAMQTETGLSRLADVQHFVVAYGQGVHGVWNAGGCCDGDTADDLAYLRGLVDRVEHVQHIDRRRVYLLGMSNGGMMAFHAACSQPGTFAAIGVVSGALLPGEQCRHTTLHVVQIFGTHDAVVPPYGGRGYRGLWFPAEASEPSRLGPGSTVVVHTWSGGHTWPGWAAPLLWAGLSSWALPAG